MTPARDVQEVLYNFAMYSFREFAAEQGKIRPRAIDQEKVLRLLENTDRVTASEATMLPVKQRKVLYDLVTAFLAYASLPDWPPYPPGFLLGSSAMQLASPVLREMHRTADHLLNSPRRS